VELMSIHAVNYLCREVLRDHDFRKAMQEDPAKALDGKDLTRVEREALLKGDVGKLFKLGAHPFLLGYLWRFGVAGLTVHDFSTRIIAAGPKLTAAQKKQVAKRAATRYALEHGGKEQHE
jgi:hypothetical protein